MPGVWEKNKIKGYQRDGTQKLPVILSKVQAGKRD